AATAAAIFNFALNLWLIPAYGMLGAAYATLAGYVLLMLVRTWHAQQIYRVHYQWRRVASILLAAGALTGIGEALPSSIPAALGGGASRPRPARRRRRLHRRPPRDRRGDRRRPAGLPHPRRAPERDRPPCRRARRALPLSLPELGAAGEDPEQAPSARDRGGG